MSTVDSAKTLVLCNQNTLIVSLKLKYDLLC